MRVLVVGAGATGAAVVRHFRDQAGVELRVVDDDPVRAGAAADLAAEVVTVDPSTLDQVLDRTDLVVPSPGIRPAHPLLQRAADRGIAVRSEIDLAAERLAVPFVAVTGTNGKTTVTTWIAAMLEASGIRTVTVGNIGTPLLEAVRAPAEIVVAEVSSFQLHFTTPAFRPRVAVLLNAGADHLDWHGSLAAYRDDKARLFGFQRDDDLLVINIGDPGAAALAGRARGRVRPFRVHEHGECDFSGDGSGLPSASVLRAIRELGSRIAVENALAAALASIDLGADDPAIRTALADPPRLHHRLEPVGQAGGVTFYDDSKATNPHATRAAVESFEHVVLIAGGRNKGLDLRELRPLAPHLRTVVAIGEAAGEVEAAFVDAGPAVVRADSMPSAVRAAATAARPGDAVLLSPACASFDWYGSYEERGRDFAAEVDRLVAEVDR